MDDDGAGDNGGDSGSTFQNWASKLEIFLNLSDKCGVHFSFLIAHCAMDHIPKNTHANCCEIIARFQNCADL